MFYCMGSSKPTAAKLLDTKLGHLQRIELPMKAAELMLESPGMIVCPVDELQRTRGIGALGADEDLRAGKLYVLFSLKRAYCKVSEEEMKVIKAACKNKKPVKVFPATSVDENQDDKEGDSSMLLGVEHLSTAAFPNYKLGNCKQWRPMLKPIYEVS